MVIWEGEPRKRLMEVTSLESVILAYLKGPDNKFGGKGGEEQLVSRISGQQPYS